MRRLLKSLSCPFSNSWAGKLKDKDPLLRGLILKEIERQKDSIDLIASENFTENSVLECLGTPTQNKYSEVLLLGSAKS